MTDGKPTNPKDAMAVSKLPLHLVPDTLRAYAALAFAEGAAKYGAYNWRVAGVRASVYRSALDRHLMKWWNGEWADETTGVPHLASIIACAGILLDAHVAGRLTDDRPPAAPLSPLIDSMSKDVARIVDLFRDANPRHHTIQGAEKPPRMKVYLAGPMSGIPEFNYPAFHRVAANLRAFGYHVFNPAERDIEVHGTDISCGNLSGSVAQAEADHGFCRRRALRDDTAWICEHADAIALLPGWEQSSGARAEKALAEALGLHIMMISDQDIDAEG